MTARPRPSAAGDDIVAGTNDSTKGRLFELADALYPGVSRRRALMELDATFRTGNPPDPLPDGFLAGRVLGTSTWGPWDGMVQRIARSFMPWKGKSFDTQTSTGLNRFSGGAAERRLLKVLWPGYRPVSDTADRIEAFEFRNRLDEGAVDPGLQVYKIDYDFEANPRLLIRRILDELVQIDDGLYLGKILMRAGGRFRPVGFFMLESPPA
jgi:hypothetical protein